MRETKWTPGPWTLGEDGPLTGGSTCSESPTVAGESWPHEVVTRGWQTIAICPAQDASESIEDPALGPAVGSQAANARFIAAAPEIYSALERLSGCVNGLGKHPVRDLDEAMEEARHALAKARGETP